MDEKKPYLAVLLIQSLYGGMFLLSKAAFNEGMNSYVFVFYRQAAATLFLAPLAVYFEWRNRPLLSFSTFCKIFMLSLFGITLSLNFFGIGLIYASPTMAAAITNCLPVITFFLALLLRMETLKVRTVAGIGKLIGMILCMGGASILAFYKGPHFQSFCIHHFLNHTNQQRHSFDHIATSSSSSSTTWMKGCFLLLLSNSFWGLWLVLQARVLKNYPAKLLFTTLQCFLSSIQSFAIAIAIEREPLQWKLGWDVGLLAVAYCGIAVTGNCYIFYLQAWVIEKKGPVFLAMSNPLNLIFTMLCSALLLCEVISIGSILGGLLLVGGLYSVLWAKRKEEKCSLINEAEEQCASESKQVKPEAKSGPSLV